MSQALFRKVNYPYFPINFYLKVQTFPALNAHFLKHDQANHETRTLIKSLISLSFVPPGAPLYNYFCLILRQFEHNQEVEGVIIKPIFYLY